MYILALISGLVQDCSTRISIANALEILQSFTKLLIFPLNIFDIFVSYFQDCCLILYHPCRPLTQYATDITSELRKLVTALMVGGQLECGTWYHHRRRLQCVLSTNLRIFKVATWHYRCRHNLKNNCIWDNLQYCLLVPRSSSKPVMLTIDLQSRKVLFIEIILRHV